MKDIITSDIILSAFLKLNGVSLDQITKIGNRGQFHFSNVPLELIDAFDLSKALVEPVAFNNQVKQLTTACRRLA
jgi:hypothetical protein